MDPRLIAAFAAIFGLALATIAGPAQAQIGSDSLTAGGRDSLTLSDALRLSLENNPGLEAVRWDMEAAAGRRRQAGARPNPEASLELENVSGTLPGLSESEMTVSIGQVFELGGKRGARIQAARAEEGLVRSDYQLARLEVASEVIRRYFEAFSAQQAVSFHIENIQIADEIRASIARRVEAGAISPAELTRAEIEFENARLRRGVAEQELALVRIRLASLWGETQPAPFRIGAETSQVDSVPSYSSLQGELNETPRLQRARREFAARQALLGLARSGRVPDVQLEAGYRSLRETGDHTYLARLSLPLPFFDRNQGAVAEARALVARAEAEAKRQKIDLARQLGESWTATSLARQRAETLRDRIVPAAERAFLEIKTGYERGRFSYVDLLEARRTWTEARQDEVEASLQYHIAIAETEFLLGRAIVHPIGDFEEDLVP